MKRGSTIGRLPVGAIAKRLPGGRRKRTPGLSTITKALPGLPGGRTAGTAGGLLLGAGAAVAASRALTGRRNEQGSSDSGEQEQGKGREKEAPEQSGARNEAGNDAKDEKDEGSGESEEKQSAGKGLFGRLKDTVGGVLKGGGKGGSGGGKKVKVTNIIEHTDIGAPRRLVYDQWTQFQDYPSFMKKVISVDQADETKLNWKAKIFWSSRTWESTIVEQVPDDHIVWRSKGPKGHVDGTVSFHELAPNLTRVLVVLEYHPQGFFEKTGNMWRAQGRRARLELKHFRRYVMTNSITRADEIEGWRGEIRDSEVVKTHEEALEEEEKSGKRGDADSSSSKNAKGSGNSRGSKSASKNSKTAEDREEEYEEVR
ncbi:SRPBCC family protein [Actinomadura madurae]|uniref:SRPBCC family protein n=1 Tax=Actinomadura madurae TaxID=1993 RepID=UPI0020D208FF|nr:SRPBCC family protein [Actinomadura madurae]MCP9953494.1 SRPBCC family protein [Actinomadura madurae]